MCPFNQIDFNQMFTKQPYEMETSVDYVKSNEMTKQETAKFAFDVGRFKQDTSKKRQLETSFGNKFETNSADSHRLAKSKASSSDRDVELVGESTLVPFQNTDREEDDISFSLVDKKKIDSVKLELSFDKSREYKKKSLTNKKQMQISRRSRDYDREWQSREFDGDLERSRELIRDEILDKREELGFIEEQIVKRTKKLKTEEKRLSQKREEQAKEKDKMIKDLQEEVRELRETVKKQESSMKVINQRQMDEMREEYDRVREENSRKQEKVNKLQNSLFELEQENQVRL